MNSAQCSGKRAYNFDTAKAEAKSLRRRKSAQAQHYHCPDCGHWHVGNTVGPPHLGGRLRRQKLERIREREAWT